MLNTRRELRLQRARLELYKKQEEKPKNKRCNFCHNWTSRVRDHQKLRQCEECGEIFLCSFFAKKHVACSAARFRVVGAKLDKICKLRRCRFCLDFFKSRKIHVRADLCKACGKESECQGLTKIHAKQRVCEICSFTSSCLEEHKTHSCFKMKMEISSQKKKKLCVFCATFSGTEEDVEMHSRKKFCPRCGFAQPCDTLLETHLNMCRFTDKLGLS
ncbi:zinc finger protein 77-like [Neocloeon triangulifer]|uniref:zinc finger protein 77-like n=1 Tax=Neocloeon triangulifer TaxID=2078957 RepID=UPI00286EE42A|nr:zinc finger protein 77-like [Neocloeon triangulifer]